MKFIKVPDFPKHKIYVLLKKKFREDLIKKSMKQLNNKNYFELSVWLNNKFKTKFNGGDIKYWIAGEKLDKRTEKIHPKFMPLWLVLELIKLTEIDKDYLDKNVISYRSGGKGLRIEEPILPIRITPELDSMIMHLFGDGAAGDFTPSYTQKNKDSFDNFIRKLKNCFGEFQHSIYFTQGKHQIKFPKAIADILSYNYRIKSFRSHLSEIPQKILKSKKENKLASIISFIVDEGSIRDLVIFHSTNKKLLFQIKSLCLDCEYKCSEIKDYSKYYSFFIRNESIEKFHNDVNKLSKKFTTCNLSFKKDDLDFIIKRRTMKKFRSKEITGKKILGTLKKGKFSAREISKLTGYAHCTVIHHLEDLYKENKIKRKKIEKGTYLWELSGFESKKKEEK